MSVFDLRPADCLHPPADLSGEIDSIKVVPCADAHTQEVFAKVDGERPGVSGRRGAGHRGQRPVHRGDAGRHRSACRPTTATSSATCCRRSTGGTRTATARSSACSCSPTQGAVTGSVVEQAAPARSSPAIRHRCRRSRRPSTMEVHEMGHRWSPWERRCMCSFGVGAVHARRPADQADHRWRHAGGDDHRQRPDGQHPAVRHVHVAGQPHGGSGDGRGAGRADADAVHPGDHGAVDARLADWCSAAACPWSTSRPSACAPTAA